MDEESQAVRDDHTWAETIKILALTTSLTWRQAFDLCYPLERHLLTLHPYDAVGYLQTLVTGDHAAQGRALVALVERAMRPLTSAVEEMETLLDQLHDSDPCDLDDHGNCQAHDWRGAGEPCPHARVREVLDRYRASRSE